MLGQCVLVPRDPTVAAIYEHKFKLAPLPHSAAPSPREPAPLWGLSFGNAFDALAFKLYLRRKKVEIVYVFLQILVFWIFLVSIIPKNFIIIVNSYSIDGIQS